MPKFKKFNPSRCCCVGCQFDYAGLSFADGLGNLGSATNWTYNASTPGTPYLWKFAEFQASQGIGYHHLQPFGYTNFFHRSQGSLNKFQVTMSPGSMVGVAYGHPSPKATTDSDIEIRGHHILLVMDESGDSYLRVFEQRPNTVSANSTSQSTNVNFWEISLPQGVPFSFEVQKNQPYFVDALGQTYGAKVTEFVEVVIDGLIVAKFEVEASRYSAEYFYLVGGSANDLQGNFTYPQVALDGYYSGTPTSGYETERVQPSWSGSGGSVRIEHDSSQFVAVDLSQNATFDPTGCVPITVPYDNYYPLYRDGREYTFYIEGAEDSALNGDITFDPYAVGQEPLDGDRAGSEHSNVNLPGSFGTTRYKPAQNGLSYQINPRMGTGSVAYGGMIVWLMTINVALVDTDVLIGGSGPLKLWWDRYDVFFGVDAKYTDPSSIQNIGLSDWDEIYISITKLNNNLPFGPSRLPLDLLIGPNFTVGFRT